MASASRGPRLSPEQRDKLHDAAVLSYVLHGEFDFHDLSAQSEDLVGELVPPEQIADYARKYGWRKHASQARRITEAVGSEKDKVKAPSATQLHTQALQQAETLRLIAATLGNLASLGASRISTKLSKAVEVMRTQGTDDIEALTGLVLPQDPTEILKMATEAAKLGSVAYEIQKAATEEVGRDETDPMQRGKGRMLTRVVEAMPLEKLLALSKELEDGGGSEESPDSSMEDDQE